MTAESRTQDFLYSFDDVQRLHNAQMESRKVPSFHYINPGIVWWAFDQKSAQRRGAPQDSENVLQASDPDLAPYGTEDSVIIVESLENMQPRVITDLFTLLGSRSFFVKETQVIVQALGSILTILTVDSLRHLDPQIQRRVIVYELPYPSIDRLAENARMHLRASDSRYIETVANALRARIDDNSLARRLELSDFIDIVHLVTEMNIDPESTNWRVLLDSLGLLR